MGLVYEVGKRVLLLLDVGCTSKQRACNLDFFPQSSLQSHFKEYCHSIFVLGMFLQ